MITAFFFSFQIHQNKNDQHFATKLCRVEVKNVNFYLAKPYGKNLFRFLLRTQCVCDRVASIIAILKIFALIQLAGTSEDFLAGRFNLTSRFFLRKARALKLKCQAIKPWLASVNGNNLFL